MTSGRDTTISKYAYTLTGNEREFAAWLFSKKMGLTVQNEIIMCKKDPIAITYHLVRSEGPNGSLPLALSPSEHAQLEQEHRGIKNQIPYNVLEMMFLEAEARRLHAERSYRFLERRGERSPTWDKLSEEDKEGYLEEAKEKLVLE